MQRLATPHFHRTSPPPSVAVVTRAAFTAVELVMGLAICSITMIALSATLLTVSQGWTATKDAHREVLTQHVGAMRVERLISNSREVLVGQVGSLTGLGPPSTLALWVGDDPRPTDLTPGQPYLYETAVLVHDPTSKKLYVYEYTRQTLTNSTKVMLGDLLGLLGTLDASASIVGNTYAVRKRTLAADVKAAAFWTVASPTGGRPSVEFVLTATDGRTVYGSATPRGQ